MIKRAFGLFFLLTLTVGLTTGCGVIYSTQKYGSPQSQRVSKDATKAEVFANLGVPNSIYKGANGEVFCYKYQDGVNILGLYAKVSRTDTIIVMDEDGIVQFVGDVPMGQGMTILASPMLDATHPVHTTELNFDPENWDLESSLEMEE
ncbi:hypothetical protein KQI84_09190 [bacterium]|nr:hypothetical protein [bacterium]